MHRLRTRLRYINGWNTSNLVRIFIPLFFSFSFFLPFLSVSLPTPIVFAAVDVLVCFIFIMYEAIITAFLGIFTIRKEGPRNRVHFDDPLFRIPFWFRFSLIQMFIYKCPLRFAPSTFLYSENGKWKDSMTLKTRWRAPSTTKRVKSRRVWFQTIGVETKEPRYAMGETEPIIRTGVEKKDKSSAVIEWSYNDPNNKGSAFFWLHSPNFPPPSSSYSTHSVHPPSVYRCRKRRPRARVAIKQASGKV